MIAVLVSAALAAEPVTLPSFREEVVVAAWVGLDRALTEACAWPRGAKGVGMPLDCDPDAVDDAIAHGRAFERHVTEDGRIRYLIGLAQRRIGRDTAARRTLEAAAALAPDRAEIWFDLGELHAAAGGWDAAAEAFDRVVELLPAGPRAWPGWFQVAQTAAHRGDAERMDQALRQALRYGFSFRQIAGQPAWRRFYADPRLHDTLDRLLLVYAEDSVRESLTDEP